MKLQYVFNIIVILFQTSLIHAQDKVLYLSNLLHQWEYYTPVLNALLPSLCFFWTPRSSIIIAPPVPILHPPLRSPLRFTPPFPILLFYFLSPGPPFSYNKNKIEINILIYFNFLTLFSKKMVKLLIHKTWCRFFELNEEF